MNINYNTLFKISLPYLILILISYTISSIIFLLLPKESINFHKDEKLTLQYQNYNVFNPSSIKNKKNLDKPLKKVEEYQLLSSLILKAIYVKKDGSGWVIIQTTDSSQTHILKQNESFRNYLLKQLHPHFIIFEKAGKVFKLEMEKSKLKFELISNTKKIIGSKK